MKLDDFLNELPEDEQLAIKERGRELLRESITADSVIEYAEKNGIEIVRGGVYWGFPKLCAANVVLHMFVKDDMLRGDEERVKRYNHNDSRVPFTPEEFGLIECGFEGFPVDSPEMKNDPLYKMGVEIARKAGYTN